MPLSLQHRHAVLLADRTRDVRTITTVVTEVLAANPETTPLDIETALRTAAGQAYLVANSTTAGFEIVLGMPACLCGIERGLERRADRDCDARSGLRLAQADMRAVIADQGSARDRLAVAGPQREQERQMEMLWRVLRNVASSSAVQILSTREPR